MNASDQGSRNHKDKNHPRAKTQRRREKQQKRCHLDYFVSNGPQAN